MWKPFTKLFAKGKIVVEDSTKNKQEMIFDPRKFVVVKDYEKSY
jgi:hypothetical protein